MSTNILTDTQLRLRYAGYLVAGILIGLTPQATQRLAAPPEDPAAAAPRIVAQTPSQTVAKIPTLHAGVRVDCTVIIDQARNAWSITC